MNAELTAKYGLANKKPAKNNDSEDERQQYRLDELIQTSSSEEYGSSEDEEETEDKRKEKEFLSIVNDGLDKPISSGPAKIQMSRETYAEVT